jgi:exopolysaccharide production protein ExoZ
VTAGWTLNFEMFFYVLFALALFLPQSVRALAIVLLLIGFVAARGLGPSPSSILFVYSNDIILEFGMGLLIGLFVTSGKRMPVSAGLAFVAVGLAVLVVLNDILPPLPRFLMMGVPCAMIVIGAVALEREGAWLKSRVMQFLGDASYSIYLTHGIFLSAFTRFWPKLMPGVIAQNMVLFSLAGLTAALIGGAMVYRLVEKPLYALRIKG